MEKNKHSDNLEEFFRKSFDELGDEPAEDGWDTPPEDSWEMIQAGLPAAAEAVLWRQSGLRGALVAMIAFLVVATAVLYYRNAALSVMVDRQAQTIDTLRQELQEMNRKESVEKSGLDRQEEKPLEEQMPSIRSAADLETLKNTHQNLAITRHGIPYSFEKRIIREKVTGRPGMTISNLGEGAFVKEAEGLNPVELPRENELPPSVKIGQLTDAVGRSTRRLAVLPLVASSVAIEAGPTPLPVRPVDFIKKTDVRFYAGGYVSPNFTSRELHPARGMRGAVLPLFKEEESAEWATEGGLKAGVVFSGRWSLEGGAGFYSIRQSSRHPFRVFFDPELESENSEGDYVATYALSIPSSFGNSEMEVDLSRSRNQSLRTGEAVLLEVETRQELNFITIPLTAAYHICKGRLDFRLRGGFALNILEEKNFTGVVRSRRMGVQSRSVRVRTAFEEVRKTGVDYVVAIGAGYRITPQLTLALEPTYRRSLSPTAGGESFRTNSYALGLHVGGFFEFGGGQ
jgi:hypothetical protein